MTLQEWLASVRDGHNRDPVTPRLKERIEVAKYDKTHVLTPGVEGLMPYEVLVIEDNQVVEVRHPLDPDAMPQEGD